MNIADALRRNGYELLVKPWASAVPATLARIALGSLLIHHGSTKVFGGVSGMMSHLASLGWPLPTLQAYLASYTEFLGGIVLVVGLFTRLSAALNIGLFTIIVFVFHGSDPFSDKEPGILFLVLSLIVMFSGPGPFSVDRYLFTKSAARGRA